jgi:hypothetical protein
MILEAFLYPSKAEKFIVKGLTFALTLIFEVGLKSRDQAVNFLNSSII